MRCQSVRLESNWHVSCWAVAFWGGFVKNDTLRLLCYLKKKGLQSVKKDTWRFSIWSKCWMGILILGVRFSRPPTYLPTYLPTRRNSFAIFFVTHQWLPPGWYFPPPRGLLFQPIAHCQPTVVRSDRRVSHPYGCRNSRWLVSQCDGLAL